MLDYPALAAVNAVIREGSFDRAADALGITASAVSQRVRGLEERLGSILITRGQPCIPTEAGAALCAHFDRVQLLESDLGPLIGAQPGPAGTPVTLRIAVNPDSLASWFAPAAGQFARQTGLLLDLILDDEAHTADRLRSGQVLAAVTSDAEPVQGCKTIPLGQLTYRACATPDFLARHFPTGVDGDSLGRAPVLQFDRRDGLQNRWAREMCGVDLRAPTHWVPSTQGFIDLTRAGVAWGLHPEPLVRDALATGHMVELLPDRPLMVQLYWTVARLPASPLRALTDAVRATAARSLSSICE